MKIDNIHILTTILILLILIVIFVCVFYFYKNTKNTHDNLIINKSNKTHDTVLYVHQPYTYNSSTKSSDTKSSGTSIQQNDIINKIQNNIINKIQNMKEVSNINYNVTNMGIKCNTYKDCHDGLVCANNTCKRVIPTYPYKTMEYDTNESIKKTSKSASTVSNYNISYLGEQCGGIVKNLPGNTCDHDLLCTSTNLSNIATGTCEKVY